MEWIALGLHVHRTGGLKVKAWAKCGPASRAAELFLIQRQLGQRDSEAAVPHPMTAEATAISPNESTCALPNESSGSCASLTESSGSCASPTENQDRMMVEAAVSRPMET
eukprot:scaffold18299_cov18-Tisochrysis_lutea.AAC.1